MWPAVYVQAFKRLEMGDVESFKALIDEVQSLYEAAILTEPTSQECLVNYAQIKSK